MHRVSVDHGIAAATQGKTQTLVQMAIPMAIRMPPEVLVQLSVTSYTCGYSYG